MAVRIDPFIKEALDATGKPYDIRMGGHHLKILLDGVFIGVLPSVGGRKSGDPAARKNLIAHIRRHAKGTAKRRELCSA